MTSYTKIAKPTGTTYSTVRAPGKIIYDDLMYKYDDSSLTYDGGNGITYTKLTKPTGTVYTKIAKP